MKSTRKWMFSRWSCLVLLALALTGGLTWALQDAPADIPLARVIPDSTLAYISVPDLDGVQDSFQETGIMELIHDPEVEAFLAPAWEALDQPLKEFDVQLKEMFGTDRTGLLELFQGQISLALVDIDVANNGMPDLVLAIGLRRAAGEFPKYMAQHLSTVPEGAEGAPSEFKIDDTPAWKYPLPMGDEFVLHGAVVQGTLFVTNHLERLESIVRSGGQEIAGALSASNRYKIVQARTGTANKAFYAYANVTNFVELVKSDMRPDMLEEVEAALEGFGIADIQDVGIGLTFEDKGVKEWFYVHTPDGRRGLAAWLESMEGKPSDLEEWVPSGAVSFSRITLDFQYLYNGMLDAVDAMDERASLDEQVMRAEEALGYSLADDVFPAIGKNWVTWATMPSGTLMPDSYTAFRVNNREVFDTVVEKFIEGTGFEHTSFAFKGQDIHGFGGVPDEMNDAMGRMGGAETAAIMAMGFGATWVWQDDIFVICSSPLAAKRFILNGNPETTIKADPKYQAVSARTSGTDTGAVIYYDLARMFTGIYNTLAPMGPPMAGLLRASDMPLDLNLLPLGETIAPYLGQVVYVYRTDAAGLQVESWSRMGNVPAAVGTSAIVAAIAIPSLMRSRVAANEQNAMMSLYTMRSVQAMWREADYDGNGVNDFWTADVAGFYATKDAAGDAVMQIQVGLARADGAPAQAYDALAGTGVPRSGYLYMAMKNDVNGQPYAQDADGDNKANTNQNAFGICAYPAVYGDTGRETFIINEEGQVFRKDIGGQPQMDWPDDDPVDAGWDLGF